MLFRSAIIFTGNFERGIAINGSFQLADSATLFKAIGAAETEALRVNLAGTAYFQLVAKRDLLRFDEYNGSTYRTLWQAALKSDLSPFGSLHVKALPEGGVTQNAIISGPNYCAYLIFGQKGILTIVNGVDNGIEISHAGNKPDNFEVSAVDRQRISVKIPAYTNTYVVAMSDFAIENA